MGDQLPDADHVSRYCRPRMLENGRPKPGAFHLRPGEEHLSVHWLEFFGAPSQTLAVEQAGVTMRTAGFSLAGSGRFAVLEVGRTKRLVRENLKVDLSVEHIPFSDDPAHAGIRGYSHADRAVAAYLADLVTDDDIYPART